MLRTFSLILPAIKDAGLYGESRTSHPAVHPREILSLPYRLIACDVMAAMLVVWNKINFSPQGVNFSFYANCVSKFSFVFTTDMAAMQSTYTPCPGFSYIKLWKDQGSLYLVCLGDSNPSNA